MCPNLQIISELGDSAILADADQLLHVFEDDYRVMADGGIIDRQSKDKLDAPQFG